MFRTSIQGSKVIPRPLAHFGTNGFLDLRFFSGHHFCRLHQLSKVPWILGEMSKFHTTPALQILALPGTPMDGLKYQATPLQFTRLSLAFRFQESF
jgi:hypothetical protein